YLWRVIGEISPAHRLDEDQHQQAEKEKITEPRCARIGKGDEQADNKECAHPIAAQTRNLFLQDLTRIDDQFLRESVYDWPMQIRFERSFEGIFGKKNAVLEDGKAGGAERCVAHAVVANDPRRHHQSKSNERNRDNDRAM